MTRKDNTRIGSELEHGVNGVDIPPAKLALMRKYAAAGLPYPGSRVKVEGRIYQLPDAVRVSVEPPLPGLNSTTNGAGSDGYSSVASIQPPNYEG